MTLKNGFLLYTIRYFSNEEMASRGGSSMPINSGTSRRTMSMQPVLLHSISNSSGSASNIIIPAEQSLASSASLSGTTSTLVADDSDSELGPNTSSRSRQKKFLKTFKQLPQEEQVLQSMIFIILFHWNLYSFEKRSSLYN